MTLPVLAVVAQQVTAVGVVRDSTTLEPVAFASVAVTSSVDAGSAEGVADRFGAFAIPGAPAGLVRLEANAFGYAPWIREYEELPNRPIHILMRPAPFTLDALGVVAGGRVGDPIAVSRDAFVVDAKLIRALPPVVETDVLRAISMSPSASPPSDFVSVPYVRGGTSEGTPVMLDGVRLFNPFHLGGFFSAVNAEAVDHATLLPSSGAGGQHLGSLSGAIEIATRDGTRERHRVTGAIGLASTRLSVEGPVGGSASYMVDGRRTYIDLLTGGLARLGLLSESFPYGFHDLHAKVTKDLGGVRRLSVTGYLNSEAVSYAYADTIDPGDPTATQEEILWLDWGNAAMAVHYRDQLAPNAFVDVTLGHSRFANDLLAYSDAPVPPGPSGEASKSKDTLIAGNGHMAEDRAQVNVTWHAGFGTVALGAQAVRFDADHDYGYSEVEVLTPLTLRTRQWRIGIFANVDTKLSEVWGARAGVRADRFAGLATSLSPFGELSYAGSWWTARISASRSHQSLSSLRNEESIGASLLAYDLLAPVKRTPVPRNTGVSAGWEGTRGALRVRLDIYARKMENLRIQPLGTDPFFSSTLDDPSLRVSASSVAQGAEVSWSWAHGQFSTLGAYRWGRVTRTVGQQTYVPRFHRAHEFEAGAVMARGASSWSSRLSVRSGQPTTPILAVVPFGQHRASELDETHWQHIGWVALGGEYNSVRLPLYVRADLGWRRRNEVTWFGGGSVSPFVSVANLFSAPNVLGAYVELTPDDESPGPGPPPEHFVPFSLDRLYLPQIPLLAFFGVEFEF